MVLFLNFTDTGESNTANLFLALRVGDLFLTTNKTGTSKVGAISKAQKAPIFQNCRKGDSLGFLNIQFVAKYQKMKERPFGDIEKFRIFFSIFQKKRKMRIFNSLIVPKNVKRGPIRLFQHPFRWKTPKKTEGGGPLEDFKKISKNKSHKAEKGAGKVS